jgi:thiol-disulfide isomerase/thioredoxin
MTSFSSVFRPWASLGQTFAAALLATLPAFAAEYRGRLDPEVRQGTRVFAYLSPASADLIAKLPEKPAADAKVWVPRSALTIKGTAYSTLLVAEPTGAMVLWLDRDRTGSFSPAERWPFPAGANSVTLSVPWDNGIYREFPLRVSFAYAAANLGPERQPKDPALLHGMSYNFNFIAAGSVDVGGKSLALTFAPRPAELAIDLTTCRISVDANFNGKMEASLGESENPSGKIPVFRVGDRYLSPKSVDMASGEIVFEDRPASDYTRFAANPGELMPDFAFVDLEGGRRKLSDYRGKYVLLDFWGTWCGPCIAEMRHLDPLYAKYQPKGFEVIGMIMEKTSGRLTAEQYAEDIQKVKAFIAKAGHKWVQATQESIERVALDVIHVNSYPTCILLGPDGRVISREARGTVLEELLAKHLP